MKKANNRRVSQETTVIYHEKQSDQGTENQNKEKQGSLIVNAMRMHEEQDTCNMYRNKINNKTSRGTHGLAVLRTQIRDVNQCACS